MKCCMGNILEVDLTSGTVAKRQVPDAVYESVLSGKGLGAWYLLRHVPDGADPLGPDNVLGFVSGALTGTGALMVGRWLAVCKSPLTGGIGEANCGGNFSPAIKQCGVDGIFFTGISPTPVYLYVDNKTAELRDATALWGMDAVESEKKLVELSTGKKKACAVTIGPSGEKLSLISGIVNDAGRIAARCGVGAVMGSKKLKGVVLAGSKQMPCADPAAVQKISEKAGLMYKKASLPGFVKGGLLAPMGTIMGKLPFNMPMSGGMMVPLFKKWGTAVNNQMGILNGDAPVKNWGGTDKDARKEARAHNPDHYTRRETSKFHCYACGQGCGGITDISDVKTKEFTHTHRPEYETANVFGALLLNQDVDSVFYINELLNRAGMDSISAGTTVAYAVECYENGLITDADTGGLKLKWGNSEDIIGLVKKMIARDGIGDYLADGVKRAVEHFGEPTRKYAMHVGGMEPGMHDPKVDPQLGVHFVADPTPGRHTIGTTLMYSMLGLEDICTWAPAPKLHPKKEDILPTAEHGLASMANACYTQITDGAGGCYFGEMLGVHLWRLVDYLNAAAGWTLTGDQYMEIGKRIQTMRQLFNVRQGLKPADWHLPERIEGKSPATEGVIKGITLRTDENVRYHWKAFGWDETTGEPLAATVTALGIPDLLAVAEV